MKCFPNLHSIILYRSKLETFSNLWSVDCRVILKVARNPKLCKFIVNLTELQRKEGLAEKLLELYDVGIKSLLSRCNMLHRKFLLG
jgi:hypothetical protein